MKKFAAGKGLSLTLPRISSRGKMTETGNLEDNNVLKWAWEGFALYDFNSKQSKKNFNRLQLWIMTLGVVVTFLALSQTELLNQKVFEKGSVYERFFQYVIVALPIIISILVAMSTRIDMNQLFIRLRAGAECIKREIYRYRVHAGITNGESKSTYPDKKLTNQVNNINFSLMETELKRKGLTPYKGKLPPQYSVAPADDGFSPLSPGKYLEYRLDDQLDYYRNISNKYEKKLKKLTWLIYIIGGLSTFFASIGLELWVALTTTTVGTFTTYLEFQQVENSLMVFNQSIVSLSAIKGNWRFLPPQDKNKRENILSLLEKTEEVLLTEHKKWVQDMEDAYANLLANKKGEPGETAENPGKRRKS